MPVLASPICAGYSKGAGHNDGPKGSPQNLIIAHTLRAEGFDASEDGTGRGTPLIPIPFDTTQVTSPQDRSRCEPGSPCHTLNANAHAPAVAFQTRIARNGRGQPKEITDALTSCEGGTHADSKPHIAGAFGVRRLTPRECERLQGFDDDWTRWDADGNELADSPRYRMMGNAVSIPPVQWIGRRIIEAV